MKRLSNFINEAIGRTLNGDPSSYSLDIKAKEKDIKKVLREIKKNSITVDELYGFMCDCSAATTEPAFYAEPAYKNAGKLLNKMGVRDESDIEMLVKTFGHIYMHVVPGQISGPFFRIARECSSIKALYGKVYPLNKFEGFRRRAPRDEWVNWPPPRDLRNYSDEMAQFVPMDKGKAMLVSFWPPYHLSWAQEVLYQAAGINF